MAGPGPSHAASVIAAARVTRVARIWECDDSAAGSTVTPSIRLEDSTLWARAVSRSASRTSGDCFAVERKATLGFHDVADQPHGACGERRRAELAAPEAHHAEASTLDVVNSVCWDSFIPAEFFA